MTLEELKKAFEENSKKRLSILESKGEDYASKTGVTENFYRVSKVAKLLNINVGDPAQYALFMCIMKLDRISNLLNNMSKINNESIEDSLDDLQNYVFLSRAIYLQDKPIREMVIGYKQCYRPLSDLMSLGSTKTNINAKDTDLRSKNKPVHTPRVSKSRR